MNNLLLFGLWIGGSIAAAIVTEVLWRWVLRPIARRTRTLLDAMVLERTRSAVKWAVLAAGLNLAGRI